MRSPIVHRAVRTSVVLYDSVLVKTSEQRANVPCKVMLTDPVPDPHRMRLTIGMRCL